jgi:hypothetical protein
VYTTSDSPRRNRDTYATFELEEWQGYYISMSVELFGITLEQTESIGGRRIFFFSAEGATLPATHVREEAIDSAIFKRFEGAKWVVWRGPVGSISRSHNILNLCNYRR